VDSNNICGTVRQGGQYCKIVYQGFIENMLSNMTSKLEQNKNFCNSERPLVVDFDIMQIQQKLFCGKIIENWLPNVTLKLVQKLLFE
jgi:hypothetical protein